MPRPQTGRRVGWREVRRPRRGPLRRQRWGSEDQGRRRGLREKHSRVGVALSLQRPTALDGAQQGAGITLQATGAGSPAQL